MKDWKRVYSNQSQYRAEIVKAVLTDRGMQPVVMNKQDSSYRFGFYEVYVAAATAPEATRIVENEITFE